MHYFCLDSQKYALKQVNGYEKIDIRLLLSYYLYSSDFYLLYGVDACALYIQVTHSALTYIFIDDQL